MSEHLHTESMAPLGDPSRQLAERLLGAAGSVPVEVGGLAVRGVAERPPSQFDYLFDPNIPQPPAPDGVTIVGGSAERSMPPARTSDRDGYWTRPTRAQVSNAAEHGYDLTAQDKYYASGGTPRRP